jgi:hypothetical protein
MKTVVLAVLWSLFVFGAEQPVRELETHAVPFPRSLIPLFRHGYLILFPPGAPAGSPLSAVTYGFTAYGPDGQFAYQEILDVPGGSEAAVRDVDFDSDGNAAIAVSARGGSSGIISGLVLLDRGGRQTSYLDTGRYGPTHVAIAPDGSIWTIGSQRDAASTAGGAVRPDHEDYMIVRHFSADGKQLNAYLPRSSFPPGLEPAIGGAGPYLAVTHDRVAILAYSGKTGANTEWIELDWNGNVLERLRTDDVLHGVVSGALTTDDHIYLQGYKWGEVYTLDHATHTWKSLQQAPGPLMGADNNSLVYHSATNAGPILLQWFLQPATPATAVR